VLLFFIKNNVCVQNRTEHYNLHWFNIHQHRVTSVNNHLHPFTSIKNF
jgi:hypothetical protein